MIKQLTSCSILSDYCRFDDAWETLAAVDLYPSISKPIDTIEILEADDTSTLSRWSVSIDGAPFMWVERVTADKKAGIFTYDSVDGDFELLRGTRSICQSAENGSLNLHSTLTYKLGIPVIEEHLDLILAEKMQCYLDKITGDLGTAISQSSKNERVAERVFIGSQFTVLIGGKNCTLLLEDVSNHGMRFILKKGILDAENFINTTLCFESLDLLIQGSLESDNREKSFRMIFSRELGTTNLERIRSCIGIQSSGAVAICEVISAAPSKMLRPVRRK